MYLRIITALLYRLKNLIFHKRTKFIALKFYYIRELINRSILDLYYLVNCELAHVSPVTSEVHGRDNIRIRGGLGLVHY